MVFVILFPPSSCSLRCSQLITAPLSHAQPPSSVVSTAVPPCPHRPLWRFPVKCDLHVTMERQQGCPPPPAHHHHQCHSSPSPLPPPLLAPWGSWEGKATQRSVHLPEGHSDSSILCPAPVMLPPQKGTLYETWQDLSTGQEELAPWYFFFFFTPGGAGGQRGGVPKSH